MNIEEAREYCLSLKNVTECFPFDDVSLVFKVEGKMFLLLPLDAVEPCVSLKCSTDYVEDLRERYTAVDCLIRIIFNGEFVVKGFTWFEGTCHNRSV